MSDGLAKTAKSSRSRAACDSCKSTKQRCDGPSVIPCRRCQLYGLQCLYSAVPAPSRKTAKVLAASAPSSSSGVAPVLPVAQANVGLDAGANMLLHDMAARLRSIESTLSGLQLSTVIAQAHGHSSSSAADSLDPNSSIAEADTPDDESPASSHSGPSRKPSLAASQTRSNGSTVPSAVPENRGETALQAINDAVELINSFAGQANPAPEAGGGAGTDGAGVGATVGRIMAFEGWTRPDAVERGVMTIDECTKSLEIFFNRIAPWIPVFPSPPAPAWSLDALRARSPVLFHVMLLTTSYFLLPSPGDKSKKVYLQLLTLVNELVAPIVLGTMKADLTPDLVRALLILLVYKPVEYSHLLHTHATTPTAAERAAKNNAASSAMIWMLETFVVRRIGLDSAPADFARAYQSAGGEASKIPSSVIDNLRLFMWFLVTDVHGALTTGRATSGFSASVAARTTRAFASLQIQPSDTRLCAFLEFYGLVGKVLGRPWVRGEGLWRDDWEKEMEEWNKGVEAWEDHWREGLREAFKKGDRHAWNAATVHVQLVKATVNASVFYRWNRLRRAAATGSGGPSPPITPDSPFPPSPSGAPPTLSPAEWRFLGVSIAALERMMFSLSEESRVLKPGQVEWDGERRVQWPPVDPATGLRKPLTPDQEMIAAMKTAIDPVTCIGLAYPLILLAKMCNAGLSRCELSTTNQPADPTDLTASPPAGSPSAYVPTPAASYLTGRPILVGRKLCVLLGLGASFLEAIAPTPSHPAAIHAQTLRTILRAGTWGQDETRGTTAAQRELFSAVKTGHAQPEALGVMDSAGVQIAQVRDAGKILAAVLAQISPANSPPPAALPDAPKQSSLSPPLAMALPQQQLHQQQQAPSQDSFFGFGTNGPFSTSAPTSPPLFGMQQQAQPQVPPMNAPPFYPPSYTTSASDFGSLFSSVSPSTGSNISAVISGGAPLQSTSPPAFNFSSSNGSFSFSSSVSPPPLGQPATAFSSPGTNSGFTSLGAQPAGAGTSMAVDVDTDSVLARAGEIDWSAIERQLGMEDGALSAGVGFGAGDFSVGGESLGMSGMGNGSTDWMNL
ncbi:hypothetical protein JCM10296v2_003341 [Rhodotorula toruloides]